MTRSISLILLLMAFLPWAPGCGTGEDTPRRAAERFVSHLGAGNTETIWQDLSDNARKKIEAKTGDTAAAKDALKKLCAAEGASQELSGTRIREEKVDGARALVTIRYTTGEGKESTRILSLVKQNDGWKLDSITSPEN